MAQAAGVEAVEGGGAVTPEQMDALVANLRRFEGSVNWMYLDSAAIPNVTVGIGVMLPDVSDAVALPFANVSAPRGATENEVAEAYARVRGMRGSMHADYYKGVTDIELSDAEVTALAEQRLTDVFLPGLQQQFHAFDALPFAAQEVLVDLAWNMGMHELAQFRKLAAAVDRRDWERAAAESHVSTSRQSRNDWRAEMFRSC